MKRSKARGIYKRQKRWGIFLIAMSLVIILIASTGGSLEDRDCTAALLFLPLGLYFFFTKTLLFTEERGDWFMGDYEFRRVRGHVEVFRYGSFLFSADTVAEAKRIIARGTV
ncbi:MAG: hypothetical protein IKZ36_02265 [Kiritimatiellae bacterium]|nr:hypothetical protein [Kiritimatiellia bacterium]